MLFAVLTGCSTLPEQEATWLQGAYYDWELFNHRVSYIHFAVDEALETSVIGGTSTTFPSFFPPDLPDGCDPNACDELPFGDVADLRAGWGRITTDEVGLGKIGRAHV